jgi:acyl-CoA synthetase (AMP-forming)/AMP-acid ligase II
VSSWVQTSLSSERCSEIAEAFTAGDIGLPQIRTVLEHTGNTPIGVVLEPFLNENLARYKHPEDLVLVVELPHNASGKVVKVQLCKDYSS